MDAEPAVGHRTVTSSITMTMGTSGELAPLGGMLDSLLDRLATLEKIAASTSAEQATAASPHTPANSARGDKDKEDADGLIESLQSQISDLRGQLEVSEKRCQRMERQLKSSGIKVAEDIPYEEAKSNVRRIAARMEEIGAANVEVDDDDDDGEKQKRLREEYFKLEAEMERYNNALLASEEYIEEELERELERRWEERVAGDNRAALMAVRRHMPPDIRNYTEARLTTEPTPNGKILPASIARRFKRCDLLQLIRVDPTAIVRMHPASLESLRVSGMTLTERRAIYSHLTDSKTEAGMSAAETWARHRKDATTERKFLFYTQIRDNLRSVVSAYETNVEVEMHGPLDNHEYDFVSNQAPVRADGAINYEGDYGYPAGDVYQTVEPAASENLAPPNAKQDLQCLGVEILQRKQLASEDLERTHEEEVEEPEKQMDDDKVNSYTQQPKVLECELSSLPRGSSECLQTKNKLNDDQDLAMDPIDPIEQSKVQPEEEQEDEGAKKEEGGMIEASNCANDNRSITPKEPSKDGNASSTTLSSSQPYPPMKRNMSGRPVHKTTLLSCPPPALEPALQAKEEAKEKEEQMKQKAREEKERVQKARGNFQEKLRKEKELERMEKARRQEEEGRKEQERQEHLARILTREGDGKAGALSDPFSPVVHVGKSPEEAAKEEQVKRDRAEMKERIKEARVSLEQRMKKQQEAEQERAYTERQTPSATQKDALTTTRTLESGVDARGTKENYPITHCDGECGSKEDQGDTPHGASAETDQQTEELREGSKGEPIEEVRGGRLSACLPGQNKPSQSIKLKLKLKEQEAARQEEERAKKEEAEQARAETARLKFQEKLKRKKEAEQEAERRRQEEANTKERKEQELLSQLSTRNLIYEGKLRIVDEGLDAPSKSKEEESAEDEKDPEAEKRLLGLQDRVKKEKEAMLRMRSDRGMKNMPSRRDLMSGMGKDIAPAGLARRIPQSTAGSAETFDKGDVSMEGDKLAEDQKPVGGQSESGDLEQQINKYEERIKQIKKEIKELPRGSKDKMTKMKEINRVQQQWGKAKRALEAAK